MILIDFNAVNFKKKSGKEKLRCPECDSRRSDKTDKSLIYDHNNGYGKCFYCEALLFNPNNEKSNKRSNIEYKRPKQEINTIYSPKLLKWLESRKISENTARSLYVTEEMYYQPSLKEEVNNICFNYYKEHKLVNKKFRSADKRFTQIAGAEVIFYNLNACIGADEVIIVEGECFDKEAKILTENGWKYFYDLTKNDKVASVDNNKKIEFVKPNYIVKKHYEGNLIKYSNSRGNFTSRTTPNHNIVYEKDGINKIKAININTYQFNIPRNGIYDGEGINISDDLLMLYVAISADFTLRGAKGKLCYGAFKKERKAIRLREILNRLNFSYSEKIDSRGYYSFHIHTKNNYEPFKLFPHEWISKLSQRQIKLILEEVVLWDGNSVPNRTMKEYNSKEISNIEFIQTLCHLSGMMSTIVKRKNKYGEWYKATMLHKNVSTISTKNKSLINYDDYVYCVSVGSGMILVKQDNNITISGNCDVMALYECGIKNCISVPNGANNNDDYWINSESYIKDIKSFIIATDNDEKGIKLREDIVQRLGKYRCKYVEWDKKDANDDLIEFGKEHVIEKIKTAKSFPVTGVLTAENLRDEVFQLYRDGLPKTIKPLQKRWDKVNEIFSVMFGQLTVVTGIPSHGKSSIIDDYVISLVNDLHLKASWFSPEHNPKGIHQSTFARKVIGKRFWGEGRMTEQELDKYIKWANEKLYITNQDEDIPTWDWLFERMKEQVLIYGINIFVIDAFNKVIMTKGGKDEIDSVLTKLTSFCIRHNVLVFLIVHPTKMRKNEKTGKYEIPTLYDCSGSSDFRNQTHNGITIYREFPEIGVTTGYTMFINTKTKFEFQGEINGTANLFYCTENSRFFSDDNLPLYSYIDYESDKEIDFETGDIKEETVFNKDIFKSNNINGLEDFEYIEPNF